MYIYLHKTQVAPSGLKNNCGATDQTHLEIELDIELIRHSSSPDRAQRRLIFLTFPSFWSIVCIWRRNQLAIVTTRYNVAETAVD